MSSPDLSIDRKAKRIKRKRKEDTPQLNTYDSVPNITDVSFPWISSSDSTHIQYAEDAWPYILFPKVKPEKYRTYTEKTVYGVGVQTENKRRSVSLALGEPEFVGSQDQLNNRHDFSKMETDENPKIMTSKHFPSPIIKKKVQQQAPHGSSDCLPKYISDFAPYGYTPLPEWLKNVIPTTINRETVLQAGKPWHNIDQCTWANELNYLSTEPNFKRIFIRNSPKLNWGESLCSLQHRQFLLSYGRRNVKPRLSLYNQFENKEHKNESKSHIISHLSPKFLTDENDRDNAPFPSEITEAESEKSEMKIEVVSPQKPTPTKETMTVPFFSQEKFLMDLSYNPSQIKKKPLIGKPAVKNFDPPWSLTISPCKWPKFVAKSTFFKNLIKKESLKMIIIGKYRNTEQWPYSANMVKVRRTSEPKTDPVLEPTKTDTTKIRKSSDSKLRRDSKRSRSHLNMSDVTSVKTDYSKKRKSSLTEAMNISLESEGKKKAPPPSLAKNRIEDEIPVFPRPPHIIDYVKGEIVEECVLAEQNKFPGLQVVQPVVIKPHNYPAQFEYRYSNLSYFEKNYSHFLHRKKTSKIAYYYAKPFTMFGDLFDGKTNLDYDSHIKFVEYIHLNNVGKLYYPNGRLAICCKNELIGSYPIRRYVIFENVPTKYLILGVFDSLGNGILYDKTGKIRLNYSQNFGTLCDTKFDGVIKWRWHNIPLHQAHKVKNSDSLQKVEQPETEMEEMRTRGINLFKNYMATMKGNLTDSKLCFTIDDSMISETSKRSKKFKLGNFTQVKPFQLKINENMTLKVRDQKHVTLWFRGDEKEVKIEMGVVLKPEIRLRQVEMDAKLVLRQKIPLEFEKIVGNTDSLLRILESVGDGGKLEPYFEPCDQLISHETQHSIVYDVPPPAQQSQTSEKAQVAEDGLYQIVHSVTFSEEKLQRKKYHGTKFKRTSETKHLPSVVSGSKIVSREVLTLPREVTMSKLESFQIGKSGEMEPMKPHIINSSVPVYMNVTEIIGDEEKWRDFVEMKKNVEEMNAGASSVIGGRILNKRNSMPFVYFGE